MDISLKNKAVSGVKWNYFGAFIKVGFQFLIGVVLARILGPEPFGLVAVMWIIISFGGLFSDLGFGSAIVQSKKISPRDIGFVFSTQVFFGCALTFVSYQSANYVALFFGKKELKEIVEAMSWLFFVQSSSQVYAAILNKNLKFGFIQKANVGTYFAAYVAIGLPAAYCGVGVWSLVLAQMTQAALYSITVIAFSGVSIRPALKPDDNAILGFGSKVVIANVTSYVLLNIDSFVIGRMLGVYYLGLYNRAMNLMNTPANVLVSGMQSVIFSACSKIQNDKETVKLYFLGAMEALSFILFTLFFSIAIASDAIVVWVFGDKWIGASEVVVPLALAMVFYGLLSLIGPVLMSINETKLEIKAQLFAIFFAVPLVIGAGFLSLKFVAWAVLWLYFIRWLCLMLQLINKINLRFSDLIDALKRPFVLSVFFMGSVTIVELVCSGCSANEKFATICLAASFGGGLGVFILRKWLLQGFVGHFIRLR